MYFADRRSLFAVAKSVGSGPHFGISLFFAFMRFVSGVVQSSDQPEHHNIGQEFTLPLSSTMAMRTVHTDGIRSSYSFVVAYLICRIAKKRKEKLNYTTSSLKRDNGQTERVYVISLGDLIFHFPPISVLLVSTRLVHTLQTFTQYSPPRAPLHEFACVFVRCLLDEN